MRVCVIGAGLFGVSTAYYLAERGHEVVLLERGSGVAGECSHANGGIIHAGNAAPWSRPGVLRECLSGLGHRDAPLRVRPTAVPAALPWLAGFLRNSRRSAFEASLRVNAGLAAYSLAEQRALRRRVGLRYDGRSNGCMVLYRTAAALRLALDEAEALTAHGVRCEPLHGEEVACREPALGEAGMRYAGALYYPDDESGDACAFANALASRAEALGAELRLCTEARAFRTERHRITALVTDQGELRADAYVVAGGSYSPQLLRPLGMQLPIQPVKGYSITLPCAVPATLPEMPVIDTARKIVLSVLGSRLRVAGFAELAGYDTVVDGRRARALFDAAVTCFPGALADVDPVCIEGWAGLRPTTIDGRPVLGATPVEGLFLATGAGHLGWTFAAGAGRFVADTVEGRCPQLDPAGLSCRRFVT